MGIWNFYFITKLFLYFGHYIGFHVLVNLVFALLLTIPIQHARLKLLRQIIGIPIGIALFYYDTWLPPFSRLFLHTSQLSGFDLAYVAEIAGRFISFPVIIALVLLYIVYFFAKKRLRISSFVLLAMFLPLIPLGTKSLDLPGTNDSSGIMASQPPSGSPQPAAEKIAQPATESELTASLDKFYKEEAARTVSFTPLKKSDPPFDIIFLQICSLSWDDLNFVNEKNNPLFKRFNIVFTNFNSAASYSGPAARRLLRGSCGQQNHHDLYEPNPSPCNTFDNLQQAGFEPQLAMNHDGAFDNFLSGIRKHGVLNITPFDLKTMPAYLQSFDGSPISDDYTVLSKWWEKRLKMPTESVALYYNSISLHDGNHYPNKPPKSMDDYHPRLTKLLDDLDRFFTQLNATGRRAVVVFIPEHGASLRGDKMQISGMREIPSPLISNVPVGIKLIGVQENIAMEPLIVPQATSYLAVSKLLSDLIKTSPFGRNITSFDEYVRNIPITEFVSENDDIVIMRQGNQQFMRSKDSDWVRYEPSE